MNITQIIEGKRIVNKESLININDFDSLISSFLREMGFYLEDVDFNIWRKPKFFKVEIGSNFVECSYLSKIRDHIFESNSGWKETLCKGEEAKYSQSSYTINLYDLLTTIITDLRELWEEHHQKKV